MHSRLMNAKLCFTLFTFSRRWGREWRLYEPKIAPRPKHSAVTFLHNLYEKQTTMYEILFNTPTIVIVIIFCFFNNNAALNNKVGKISDK